MLTSAAFTDFLDAVRHLMEARLGRAAGSLRAVPTAHALRSLEEQCLKVEPLQRVANEIGGIRTEQLADALQRSGVLLLAMRGETIDRDAAWAEMQPHLRGVPAPFLGALQLEGVGMAASRLPIGDGFELRCFSEDEWADLLQPPIEDEQLDAEKVAYQVFLTKDGEPVMPPLRERYSSAHRGPRSDSLWTNWWRPLLALALYRPEYLSVGMRLELTPRWRLRTIGAFDGDYESCQTGENQTEEEIPCLWRNFIPQSYELSAESEEEFTAFAADVMTAIDRAVDVDGDRVRIAAKRLLSASFKLPSHSVRWRPDEDVAEDSLLGLVRVGDGLLAGPSQIRVVPAGKLSGFTRETLLCGKFRCGS